MYVYYYYMSGFVKCLYYYVVVGSSTIESRFYDVVDQHTPKRS